jgi:acyl-CoA dehydrogenase
VADGCAADLFIVSVQEDEGVSLFLVANDPSTVTCQVIETLDPSRPQAEVKFQQSVAERLGPAGQGLQLLAKLEDCAAVLLAFEQIGGAQAALDMGIAYCKDRYAFGRQVASFQAIKHKFADMYVALELARSNAYYGAWALANNSDELPLAAATARVSASDAFYLVSKENIQAHGGMGFTWEFDCHLYYRRAQYLSLLIGSNATWRQRLAERLLATELST